MSYFFDKLNEISKSFRQFLGFFNPFIGRIQSKKIRRTSMFPETQKHIDSFDRLHEKVSLPKMKSELEALSNMNEEAVFLEDVIRSRLSTPDKNELSSVKNILLAELDNFESKNPQGHPKVSSKRKNDSPSKVQENGKKKVNFKELAQTAKENQVNFVLKDSWEEFIENRKKEIEAMQREARKIEKDCRSDEEIDETKDPFPSPKKYANEINQTNGEWMGAKYCDPFEYERWKMNTIDSYRPDLYLNYRPLLQVENEFKQGLQLRGRNLDDWFRYPSEWTRLHELRVVKPSDPEFNRIPNNDFLNIYETKIQREMSQCPKKNLLQPKKKPDMVVSDANSFFFKKTNLEMQKTKSTQNFLLYKNDLHQLKNQNIETANPVPREVEVKERESEAARRKILKRTDFLEDKLAANLEFKNQLMAENCSSQKKIEDKNEKPALNVKNEAQTTQNAVSAVSENKNAEIETKESTERLNEQKESPKNCDDKNQFVFEMKKNSSSSTASNAFSVKQEKDSFDVTKEESAIQVKTQPVIDQLPEMPKVTPAVYPSFKASPQNAKPEDPNSSFEPYSNPIQQVKPPLIDNNPFRNPQNRVSLFSELFPSNNSQKMASVNPPSNQFSGNPNAQKNYQQNTFESGQFVGVKNTQWLGNREQTVSNAQFVQGYQPQFRDSGQNAPKNNFFGSVLNHQQKANDNHSQGPNNFFAKNQNNSKGFDTETSISPIQSQNSFSGHQTTFQSAFFTNNSNKPSNLMVSESNKSVQNQFANRPYNNTEEESLKIRLERMRNSPQKKKTMMDFPSLPPDPNFKIDPNNSFLKLAEHLRQVQGPAPVPVPAPKKPLNFFRDDDDEEEKPKPKSRYL